MQKITPQLMFEGHAEETEFLFGRLSVGGKIFMPLDTYPFSEKFGWVADKYGVSWQLNLKR
jgi:predicted 3-demethylubiquinone-9 3-methyltransferase (glyoxalase superfamily)